MDNNPHRYQQPGSNVYRMQQCGRCKAGFTKVGRQCVPLSVPPVIAGGSQRVLYLPAGAAKGAIVTRVDAVAGDRRTQGTVNFSIESSTLPLSIDPQNGTVQLAAELTESGSFVVAVRDTQPRCLQLDSNGEVVESSGGCVSRLVVTVQLAKFIGCPTTIGIYTLDANATAEVSWTEPVVPEVLGALVVSRSLGNTSSTAMPYRYGLGRHAIEYIAELPGYGAMVCAFNVWVLRGVSVRIPNVAMVQSVNITQQSLVVDVAVSSNGARLPRLELAEATTTTPLFFGFRHHNSLDFSVRARSGYATRLQADLSWCEAGALLPSNKSLWVPLKYTVRTLDSSDAIRILELESDSAAEWTLDRTCLRIRFKTTPLQSRISWSFRAMVLELSLGPHRMLRYFPAQRYQLSVVTLPELQTGGPGRSSAPPPALSVGSTATPYFLNCPTRPVEVTAPFGQAEATVSWTSPIAAVDNFAPVTVHSTLRSGDSFSIANSPHAVTYTATTAGVDKDDSLIAVCQFNVIVSYTPKTAIVSSKVDWDTVHADFVLVPSFADLPDSDMHIVRQPMRFSIETPQTFWQRLPVLDTADFTELRLEAAVSIAGFPLRHYLRTMTEARSAQLVLNLVWHRDDVVGGNSSQLMETLDLTGQEDIGVWLEFEDYALDESADVALLPEAEKKIVLPARSRLRTVEARVDPVAGVISVTNGYSLPFRRGFSFSKKPITS
jgi:hypothetical protein